MRAVQHAMCLGLLSASLLACAPAPTQIIVHVDAEDELRGRTDQLRIRIWGRADDESVFDDDAFQFETAPTQPGDIPWPWRVDLRPGASDPTRVWRIEAAAYDGAAPAPDDDDISPNLLVASRTSASYVEGRIQHVYLLLYDACLDGDPCLDPNSTCVASGRCEMIRDPRFFDPEAGTPEGGMDGGLDAGPEDSGPVDAGPDGGRECADEECNTRDDDCDGMTDEGFDLDSNPDRCGGCDTVCEADNTVARCVDGSCDYDLCEPGYRNCDAADGCETPIDAANCAACGVACPSDLMFCDEGTCVNTCEPTTNCGGTCADLETDPDNCRDCGRACEDRAHAIRDCVGAECVYTCEVGWADCDRDLTDDQDSGANTGCEIDLTRLDHCGGCDTPCEDDGGACTFPSCATGTCLQQPADGVGCTMGPCDGVCSGGSCGSLICPSDAGPPDAGPCAECAYLCCGIDCCEADEICSPDGNTCVPSTSDAGPPDAGPSCGPCADDCCEGGATCCGFGSTCVADVCEPDFIDGGAMSCPGLGEECNGGCCPGASVCCGTQCCPVDCDTGPCVEPTAFGAPI